ncbi:NUDIX hydrolase [Cohnella luojiensis]|uniref:NUDIX domain-containing protein n=1 Tax=Cohnella luojiensis TaxID=652876 RepID=A0A4Y8M6R2_9BACL|nr:NUDIX domain-containing protein [Cohnella luojiensis]TFE31660.1 NUDIX domain-containing protein [Cohnella luojiensis]
MVKEISAGGVVYRKFDGQLEIQLIEDRFGKMTLAKGKMEPGETVEQTALREILEETGISGQIAAPLTVISYRYEHAKLGSVQKEVHYFLVEAGDDQLQAQIEEISGVAWHEPAAAWQLQFKSGYDNNDEVLRLAYEKLGLKHI